MKHGRPLRFLTLVVIGWTSLRVAMLWPAIDSPDALIRALAPPAAASVSRGRPEPIADRPSTAEAQRHAVVMQPHGVRRSDHVAASLALAAPLHFEPLEPIDEPQSTQYPASLPPPLAPTPIERGAGRLSGSVWLIARDGGGRPALAGSQLGGSQAGVRLAYALDARRRVAAVGRIATPLEGRGREAALGLEWRVSDAIRLIAEQRFALETGSRGGPTLGIIAGIGPKPIGAGFHLEAYGQAGVIARGGAEAYGDGAVRAYRPLTRIGNATIDLGTGTWGGAQRGASRLDIGPSVGLALPIANRQLRLTIDWRQRIAGNARPPSGPALSIGTDF